MLTFVKSLEWFCFILELISLSKLNQQPLLLSQSDNEAFEISDKSLLGIIARGTPRPINSAVDRPFCRQISIRPKTPSAKEIINHTRQSSVIRTNLSGPTFATRVNNGFEEKNIFLSLFSGR